MTRYNGWTNYATWRVGLEVFDGMTRDDIAHAEHAKEFAELCIEHALEGVDSSGCTALLEGWARAFLADVNWEEIFKSLED